MPGFIPIHENFTEYLFFVLFVYFVVNSIFR